MAAYYNEIEPYAAQWLRNLIAAGHIAPGDVDTRDIRPMRVQGPTEGSSFGLAVDGTLDKGPKPLSATPYLPQTYVARASHGQAYAQSQSRAPLRMPRKRAARPDSGSRSGDFGYQAAAFLSCERGRSPPFLAVAHGSFVPPLRCLRAGNHPSIATCCAGQDRSETKLRRPGNCAQPPVGVQDSSCAIGLCIELNSTSYESGTLAIRFRTRRNEAAIRSSALHFFATEL